MRRSIGVIIAALLWAGTAQAQTQVLNIDEIRAPASLSLDAASNNILPVAPYDQNLGSLSMKFLSLHAAELWVETLVAQNTLATIGGRILVGPTTTLTANLGDGAGDTTITVKHNDLASGDRVVLEANGKVEFLAITSAPSGGGPYSYTVTRNLDGSGRDLWYAGDAVFSTGTTGDGFLDIYSVRGLSPTATAYGPTIVGNVRLSSTYNDWAPRWAVGNLDGLYGYTGATYGAAFGNPSDVWMGMDATNGLRISEGGSVRAQWDTSGNILIGRTGTSQSNVYITSDAVKLRTATTDKVVLGTDGSITVGEVGASLSNVYITSGAVKLRTNTTDNMTLDTSGNILIGQTGASQSNVYITSGAVKLRNDTTDKVTLATDGTVTIAGTLTVSGSTALQNNLSIGTSGALYSGASGWNSGTGFWMDYNSGSPRFFVGNASGNKILWDPASGGHIYVKDGNVEISSGVFYLRSLDSTTGSDYPVVYSTSNERLYQKTDGVSGSFDVKTTSDATYGCPGSLTFSMTLEKGIVTGMTCL